MAKKTHKNKSKNRIGGTLITSVSLTKFFHDLVNKYNLSPTEVFRRGVAVTLCDMGELKYITETNIQRSEQSRLFLETVSQTEKIMEELWQKKKLIDKLLKDMEDL